MGETEYGKERLMQGQSLIYDRTLWYNINYYEAKESVPVRYTFTQNYMPSADTASDPSSTMQHSWEHGLPAYLQHDLDAYKEGLEKRSPLLDCLWGELYGSINIAEINDGTITPEHADYLRQKYLWG